jgi:hypothetical protein
LATPEHHSHAFFRRFKPTLADCYNHPFLRIEISDFQTKMLGWSARNDIVFPAQDRAKFATFSAEHADFYYCPADASTLAMAQQRLQTDLHFACLDRPVSVQALCRRIGGDAALVSGFENRTPSVPWAPTEFDIEVVGAHNTFDKALYDFALSLIDNGQSTH